MNAAENLRKMAAETGAPLKARIIVIPPEDGIGSARHTIVVCAENHLEWREDRLDAFGCCPECNFLASYDPKLAELVVALINAASGNEVAFVATEDLSAVLSEHASHSHLRDGHWDTSGSPCATCAARGRLHVALGENCIECGEEFEAGDPVTMRTRYTPNGPIHTDACIWDEVAG
jgi:hypothetical protein